MLGSGAFIPGFEDPARRRQGRRRAQGRRDFPENYQAAHLAGKEATFDVKVQSVSAPDELALDDDFAKKYAFENLEKLREAIKGRSRPITTAPRGKS